MDGSRQAVPAVTRWARRSGVAPEVLGLLGLLIVLQGYPLFLIFASSLNTGDPFAIPPSELGLGNFLEVLDHLDWIGNTLLVASLGTVLATSIGVALAWIIHRTTVPGRGIFATLIAIPYPLGPLVGALAWSHLGSPTSGLLNELFTAVTGIGEVEHAHRNAKDRRGKDQHS